MSGLSTAAGLIDVDFTVDDEYSHLSFRLSDEFIDGYREREVKWGFDSGGGNSLGEIIWLTKYSRVKADGTKEKWYEGCRRVIEGMYSILKDHCQTNRTPWNHVKAQRAAEDAYERLFTFKWTPPGRGLWMMGTKFVWEEGSASLQNCLRGTEEFYTREYGVVNFMEVVGETVTVLGREGWQKAEVRQFGEQPVQRITFAPTIMAKSGLRTNVRREVVATWDHRWVLADGTETTNLDIGDVVLSNVALGLEFDEYHEGFKHGLIFGDGTAGYRYVNGDREFHIRLCDERTKPYTDLFEDVNHEIPSYGGDPWCRVRSSRNLKAFPAGDEGVEYLIGFLKGWIAADATMTPAGNWQLASQHPEAAAWLERYGALAGHLVVGINADSVMETNYGPRKFPCWRFTLTGDDMRYVWKVVSIEELPEAEPVYCAVVPEEGAFTLVGGIYTGNCAFLSTEFLGLRNPTLPFTRLMEMSMLGIGVGFDTLGAGNLTIHKPEGNEDVFVIPDNREGWCDSVDRLLRSYFQKSVSPVTFDYSQIRPAGSPIKRFGGTAAGPGPLRKLHESIRQILDGREGQEITSTDIVDIQNLIGKCVVAGNVRRSAELALGAADDKEFLQLKDVKANAERMGADGWGWLSNNSVIANVEGDYDYLVDQIAINGEPGLIFLDLLQSSGRLLDPPDNKDYRVRGVNPCSEQSLENFECCTLSETYPIHHEDFEDYVRTLKVSYLYGKAVTLLPTHWPESNEVMQRNRRIGLSASGLVQFVESRGLPELQRWMDRGYQEVVARDRQYSEWLGVRESIKKTSIKPSGTVSLLAGVTPGVHWPEHDIYLRRMRFRVGDPMVEAFEEAGYHIEPDVMDPEATMVVTFPTRGPEVRTNRDVSVWEKVALASIIQRYWADNSVSATFTFRDDEKDQIGPVIRTFTGQLKAMSFLPMLEGGAYAQMPYERIDDEEWEKSAAKIIELDLSEVYHNGVAPEGEKYCTTDVCLIEEPE